MEKIWVEQIERERPGDGWMEGGRSQRLTPAGVLMIDDIEVHRFDTFVEASTVAARIIAALDELRERRERKITRKKKVARR